MNPRALPPVTQGSALQAPECLWDIIRGRKMKNPSCGVVPSRHRRAYGVKSVAGYHPEDRVFISVYRLAMDAKTLRGDDVAG